MMKAAATAAFITCLLFFGSFTCSKNNQLTSVELVYSYPLSYYKQNDEVKIYSMEDTIAIYYYSDYVLYRLPPTIKFETGEKIKGTNPYFIYHKNKSFGFMFRSLKDTSQGNRYRIDSILAHRGMGSREFDLPGDSLWSLTEVVDNGRNELIEKFAFKMPPDETSIDSIYYYYSKSKMNIEYSFSKKLDSMKSMKLFKVRMLYNERYSNSANLILPKREMFFEIREKIVSNSEEIIGFINRFRQTHVSG